MEFIDNVEEDMEEELKRLQTFRTGIDGLND